jgi:D-alanine-D-alanine ligase
VSEEKNYKPDKYGKVAVLMGGLSAERPISLESGQAVFAALKNKGVDAHVIDVQRDVLKKLEQGNFDRVFIALHGRGGEDGQIQGALETLQLPYTGSGVLGSALAMDKCRTKKIWQSYGLPTPAFVELSVSTDWKAVCDELGLPLMVKPVHEGSSFGASKVKRMEDIEAAWRTAYRFDKRVMAECWITGNEYTVPLLAGLALPVIRLVTPREFYDYEAKYESETTLYLCPCDLDTEQEQELGKLALSAFDALGASGWGRIDLLMDEQGKPWLIEANTIPGMTSHSLVPMAAKQAGMSFDDLVIEILNTTMQEQIPA